MVWLVGGGGVGGRVAANGGLLCDGETVARCPMSGDAVPYSDDAGVIGASVKAFLGVAERAPHEDDRVPFAAAHSDTAIA